MGCDIHVHTEIKVGGVWHHYSTPDIGRDYWLFALMAGVRTSKAVPQGLFGPPRGLPDGLSLVTKMDVELWKYNGHSHSWLTGSEMAKVIEEFDQLRGGCVGFGSLFGNDWDFDPGDDGYPRSIEKVRVVFWFDN